LPGYPVSGAASQDLAEYVVSSGSSAGYLGGYEQYSEV